MILEDLSSFRAHSTFLFWHCLGSGVGVRGNRLGGTSAEAQRRRFGEENPHYFESGTDSLRPGSSSGFVVKEQKDCSTQRGFHCKYRAEPSVHLGMQSADRMFTHERDNVSSYGDLDGDFHDLDDASGNAGLVNSFQCEYQVRETVTFAPRARGKGSAKGRTEAGSTFGCTLLPMGRAARLGSGAGFLDPVHFLFLTATVQMAVGAQHIFHDPDPHPSPSTPPLQELGLDPVVSNLQLDRVHPAIQNLAAATQGDRSQSISPAGQFHPGPPSPVLKAGRCRHEPPVLLIDPL